MLSFAFSEAYINKYQEEVRRRNGITIPKRLHRGVIQELLKIVPFTTYRTTFPEDCVSAALTEINSLDKADPVTFSNAVRNWVQKLHNDLAINGSTGVLPPYNEDSIKEHATMFSGKIFERRLQDFKKKKFKLDEANTTNKLQELRLLDTVAKFKVI